jgi:hypothetical protein
MRAVVFESFQGLLSVQEVPEPLLPDDGVVIQVRASPVDCAAATGMVGWAMIRTFGCPMFPDMNWREALKRLAVAPNGSRLATASPSPFV